MNEMDQILMREHHHRTPCQGKPTPEKHRPENEIRL